MELSFTPYRLQFRHPFGVSSNIRTETTSVFVKLSSGDHAGFGEACLPSYLGGDVQATLDFLQAAKEKVFSRNTRSLQELLDDVRGFSPGNYPAKAALDIALHDLFGKLVGRPVYELLGLEKPAPRTTSYTIALDSPDKLSRKVIEASDYTILKIKCGSGDDKKLIRQIRQITYKPLYVDVNQGWKDKHMVLDMIGWMKEQNVLLVEQPMPIYMRDEMAWVTAKSPLPTIADESAKTFSDLENVKGVFSGINLKLMKCGGIREGLRMATKAKELGLKVMLGCMAESSCGTAAMAQLLDLGDFVDLDAPLLYRNDPFTGIRYQQGQISVSDRDGLGVIPFGALGWM